MFVWVLLFRKLIARVLIGTYIHRVLVINTPEFMVYTSHNNHILLLFFTSRLQTTYQGKNVDSIDTLATSQLLILEPQIVP